MLNKAEGTSIQVQLAEQREALPLSIIQVDKDQLIAELTESIVNALNKDRREVLEEEMLTCKQVEKLLDISHSTRIEWSKQGLIQSHKLSSRTYYKRSEIMAAMIAIEPTWR